LFRMDLVECLEAALLLVNAIAFSNWLL